MDRLARMTDDANPYQPMLDDVVQRIKSMMDGTSSKHIERYMRDWLFYGIEPLPLAAPRMIEEWDDAE